MLIDFIFRLLSILISHLIPLALPVLFWLTGRKSNKNVRAGAAGDIPLQAAPTETVV